MRLHCRLIGQLPGRLPSQLPSLLPGRLDRLLTGLSALMAPLADALRFGSLVRLDGMVVLAVRSFYTIRSLIGQLACVAQLSGAAGTTSLPVWTLWTGLVSQVAWATGPDGLDY